MNTYAWELRNVTQRFGDFTAVRDINLAGRQGSVTALLGPNGSGKSTTMDILLGLRKPTSGESRMLGMTPAKAVNKGLVGAMLQNGGMPQDLRVAEILRTMSAMTVNPAPLSEVVEKANLGSLMKRKQASLSGGERQRVRLALALLGRARLLVLDEPTNAMDVGARRDFWRMLREEAASGGMTVLFATHYLQEAADAADRVVVLAKGNVISDRPLQEMFTSQVVVSGSLPGGADESSLGRLCPAGTRIETHGESFRLLVTESPQDALSGQQTSDALLRRLLTETRASGLRVSARSIDDIYTELVEGENK
ncbi:ABC transporter ATP-binding protein [Dermabacteraceae bacterium TAE3-ERU27]|nr:ABC transporter ATP-binding protein [Dermabacteraceae bacterium TAE3-ERU27]